MQRPLTPDQLLHPHIADPFERCRAVERERLPSSTYALLGEAARDAPERLAWHFIDSGETITYRALLGEVARVAHALSRSGTGEGSRVGVMLPNVPAFPITWLALGMLRAVTVPINPAYTGRELGYVIEDAELEALVLDAACLPALEAVPERGSPIPASRTVVHGGVAAERRTWQSLRDDGDPAFRPAKAPDLDDLHNIQYTSGTTGFPKGAMLTHRYWVTTSRINARRDGVAYERILVSTPFFYMDPQWLLLMAFHQRATLYVAARQSASRFADWLHRFRIHFCLFPEAAASRPASPGDSANEVRRANIYGLRPSLHAPLEQRFGFNAREAFGMTEIGSTLFMPLESVDMISSGSCGIAGPFRECRIVDPAGKDVVRGDVGELVVRGSGILLGYWRKPDATRDAFHGDWFRTGDLFRQDARGYHYIVGRAKDMIRRSSENIAAREVEAVLRSMAEIEDVAVVAVPDELRREEVKAYVMLRSGLTAADVPPEAIVRHAEAGLARFKVPRYIEYRAALPRTPSGKIPKHELVAEKADLRADSWDRVDGVWR